MTDMIAKLGSTAAVFALLAGLWATYARQQYPLLAGLNAAVAFGIFAMSTGNVVAAIRYNETPMLLFFAFEAGVVLALIALLLGVRVPDYVIATLAAINLLLMALLAVFLLTFRMSSFI